MTSSGCVARSWRGGGPRRALLARLLRGVREQPLGPDASKAVGELCAAAGSDDVGDGHITLIARGGDVVVTSDADDLRALLKAAASTATVRRC